MVTNDTGPMHLGAAAGAPMVVIWDGSPAIRPLRWGHFFRPDIINLDPHDGSSGATQDRQRRLATISAETVLTQVQRIIRKSLLNP
jgi:ADP-heptose:LPS heptosyltransferase